MSETLSYLLAQAVTLTAQTTSVTDSAGTNNRTVAAGTYRVYLAKSGAAGTTDDPKDVLATFQAALNGARWSVALRASGLVRITYLGTSTGSITWGSATALRNLLGFDADLSGLATNDYVESAYLPTHCIFGGATRNDTGWKAKASRVAASRMPTGRVYGWTDGLQQLTRSLDLRLLPKDWTVRATLASSTSAPPTPAYGPAARLTNPASGEPGQAPPWGASETIATGAGVSCGFTDRFEDMIAGSVTTFDHVYLTPNGIPSAEVVLSEPGWDARRDLTGLELSLFAQESR
jgi:hypothetical protein